MNDVSAVSKIICQESWNLGFRRVLFSSWVRIVLLRKLHWDILWRSSFSHFSAPSCLFPALLLLCKKDTSLACIRFLGHASYNWITIIKNWFATTKFTLACIWFFSWFGCVDYFSSSIIINSRMNITEWTVFSSHIWDMKMESAFVRCGTILGCIQWIIGFHRVPRTIRIFWVSRTWAVTFN